MPRWNVNFEMRLDQDSPDLTALVRVIHAIAELVNGLPLPPGVDRRLNTLNIARAVAGTTGIEGSTLTVDEVEKILENPGQRVLPPSRDREVDEARNAEAVMLYIARNTNTEVTEPLICKLHELTTQGIPYEGNVPGRYRSHQAMVGSYLPPGSHDEIRRLMDEFVSWINSGLRRNWDCVVRAVVSHFFLVSIHPFGDGNGRTSRALESFVLYKGGVNVRGFYSLANFYYRNRTEYVRMLDFTRFQSNGDLTPFVLFALKGLREELDLVRGDVIRVMRSIAFRDYARQQIFGPKGPASPRVAHRLLTMTVHLPEQGITMPEAIQLCLANVREYRRINERTIRRDIETLLQLEVAIMRNNKVASNIELMDRYSVPFPP